MIKHASISENGTWVGDAIIHICEYCGARYPELIRAHFGATFGEPDKTEAVYQAIEEAIERGKANVEYDGSRYSWAISEHL